MLAAMVALEVMVGWGVSVVKAVTAARSMFPHLLTMFMLSAAVALVVMVVGPVLVALVAEAVVVTHTAFCLPTAQLWYQTTAMRWQATSFRTLAEPETAAQPAPPKATPKAQPG
jgi:hypothetical protein